MSELKLFKREEIREWSEKREERSELFSAESDGVGGVSLPKFQAIWGLDDTHSVAYISQLRVGDESEDGEKYGTMKHVILSKEKSSPAVRTLFRETWVSLVVKAIVLWSMLNKSRASWHMLFWILEYRLLLNWNSMAWCVGVMKKKKALAARNNFWERRRIGMRWTWCDGGRTQMICGC